MLDEFDKGFKPVLDLVGVRTWAAFAKGASSVGVHVEGDVLHIVPSQNAGAKLGFLSFSGVDVTVKMDSSPAAIGEAVKQAISLCTS